MQDKKLVLFPMMFISNCNLDSMPLRLAVVDDTQNEKDYTFTMKVGSSHESYKIRFRYMTVPKTGDRVRFDFDTVRNKYLKNNLLDNASSHYYAYDAEQHLVNEILLRTTDSIFADGVELWYPIGFTYNNKFTEETNITKLVTLIQSTINPDYKEPESLISNSYVVSGVTEEQDRSYFMIMPAAKWEEEDKKWRTSLGYDNVSWTL